MQGNFKCPNFHFKCVFQLIKTLKNGPQRKKKGGIVILIQLRLGNLGIY